MPEKKSGTTTAYRCPACKMLQNKPFEECPQCGVLVSRYLKRFGGATGKLEETTTEIVTQPVSLFTPTMVVRRPPAKPQKRKPEPEVEVEVEVEAEVEAEVEEEEVEPEAEAWTPPEEGQDPYVPFDPLTQRATAAHAKFGLSPAVPPPSPPPQPPPPPPPLKRRAPLNAREVADDLVSGMIECEIMGKYELSGPDLLRVIDALLKRDLVKPWDVHERIAVIEGSLSGGVKRKMPRYRIAVHVAIRSVHDSDTSGVVVDVSDEGVGIEGLACEEGVTETFVITRAKRGETTEIFFDAECRWTRVDPRSRKPLAGLRVSRISRSNLAKLRALIRELISS